MRKSRSRSKSKRSTPRRRRRRRNGAGLGRTAFLALMAKGKAKARRAGPKRRKTRTKRARKAKARKGRRIRPTILMSRGKLYRPARSKYFPRSRRVNGRRRRSNGSNSLVKAIKNVFQVRTVSHYASIGGGIFLGTLFSRMLNTGLIPFTATALIPASILAPIQKIRPIHGLLHMVLGAIVAAKVRNKYVQDVAIGVSALGGFDLVTQILARAGVIGLPTFSGMNVDLVSGRTMYSGMNVNLRTNQVMAGMNVDLKGMARSYDAESDHLADNINDMLS